jgi:hypothetical protein
LKHLSSEEFSTKLYESEQGKRIIAKVDAGVAGQEEENAAFKQWMVQRYRNNWISSLNLLIKREMLLWWRDKTQIGARVAQGESNYAISRIR